MPWCQFSMELGPLDPAAVEALLEAHGAQAVTYTDAEDSPLLEPPPGATPLWPATRVSALFDPDFDAAALSLALTAALGLAEPPAFRLEILEDRPWEREWLKDFHAMRFGSRLWVCPGDESPDQTGAVTLRLDPGLAFGTGTHATTALCLEWLDGNALAGCRLLDYGCGSGILAIAAVLLGATDATAVDIDPQALAATRRNAQRNGVAERISVCEAAGLPPVRFERVVANILAAPLVTLAPTLASRTAPAGQIALSGILLRQTDEVLAAYEPWFRLGPPSQREDWVLISGIRRED